jgi:hypothetical protein
MTPLAGATATRSGAYSGGSNNVISATLRTQVQAICSLPNLSHVGLFRPQLRFYASATTCIVYLKVQVGDGPFRIRDIKVPVVAGWNHVDLGSINIPQTTLGTQKWSGIIYAQSTDAGGETFAVDVMWLLPAEKTGRAYGAYSYQPGILTALDDFTGTTSGGTLNGRTPLLGAAWATSGVATDFTFADAPSPRETITRATTSEASARLAVFGSSATDTEVGTWFYQSGASSAANGLAQGVLARHADTSNYLRASYKLAGTFSNVFQVVSRVAASETVLASYDFGQTHPFGSNIRLIVRATGDYTATLFDASGTALCELKGNSSVLATGGALASGKAGIYDYNPTASAGVRWYDDVYAATPAAEPIVCYAGQSIEFRHDGTVREDSTGTYSGKPTYLGPSSFTIPNAGGPDRKTRIAVIARRNDIQTGADDDLVSNATMDSTTVSVYVVPRYLAVPR